MQRNMKPLSFDHGTAREVTGDALARIIEAKAREDADALNFDPPKYASGETYWGQVQASMHLVTYLSQYAKRAARNERKRST